MLAEHARQVLAALKDRQPRKSFQGGALK